MKSYRYIGKVFEVAVSGKGPVKRGDIVKFTDDEAKTLSPVNWEKIKPNKQGFISNKNTKEERSGYKQKRTITRLSKEDK